MKIGFIGAGKVGTAFGMYLRTKGLEIQGYASKTMDSAIRAAEKTKSCAYAREEELAKAVDVLFITTPDDEIKNTCHRLVEQDYLRKGQILIHMSGAASSKILFRAKEKGCYVYSLHPLQAFADEEKALLDLPHTVFSIEGDEEKMMEMEKLLHDIGNTFFIISTEHKVLYHSAACIFSNYLVTLIDQGMTFLSKIGIDEKEGFKAMLPLIMGTIKNIESFGTEKALTGPIARGDKNTIEHHMKVIQEILPEKERFYHGMAKMTLELAQRDKLKDPVKIEELKKILGEVEVW